MLKRSKTIVLISKTIRRIQMQTLRPLFASYGPAIDL